MQEMIPPFQPHLQSDSVKDLLGDTQLCEFRTHCQLRQDRHK